MENPQEMALLEVGDLRVYYHSRRGGKQLLVKAVDGVSFSMGKGDFLGLVGESGSGKSTIGRAIVRLADVHSGSIRIGGEEIQALSATAFHPFRKRIQMVFQDPYHTLNPRLTIRETLEEPLRIHFKAMNGEGRRRRIGELLEQVELEAGMVDRYPHQFSGGQRQRIGIARALAVKPDLLICDEAVSALDVTVQAQILKLIQQLQQSCGFGCLFIGHDLAVMKQISHRVLVMEKGKLVEQGTTAAIFSNPQNDYTKRLLSAVPRMQSLKTSG